MHILTATDLVGITPRSDGKQGHYLVCPWCGEQAWAASEHMQCLSSMCPTQAASPEDIVAKVLGGYDIAEEAIAKNFRRPSNIEQSLLRQQQRRIMDFWIQICSQRPTTGAQQLLDRAQANGLGLVQSRYNACAVDQGTIVKLLSLARVTGATYPEAWMENPPKAAIAFCLQSRPHTIDRIALMRGSRTNEIVWHRYAAGFSSLIGLNPSHPRLLASNPILALNIQHALEGLGIFEEVSSIHTDAWNGGPCPRWSMDAPLLTAVVRDPRPGSDTMLHDPNDLVEIQEALDNFPLVEKNLRAQVAADVLKGKPRHNDAAWENLRYGFIASMIPSDATQTPPRAASLFERTGTKRRDAAALITRYKNLGRFNLAEDIQRLSETRVFYRDPRATVRETANQYEMTTSQGKTVLANFSIKVKSNVLFDDAAEAYCHGSMRCGNVTMDVLFPHTLLHNQSGALQDELQRQIALKGKTASAGHLPTVIQMNHFRKFVMPHLKSQIAEADLVTGTDRLGWRADRKSYNFPGFTADASGYHEASPIFCPSVSALRFFQAKGRWSNSCSSDLDSSCQDIIAMLIASNVRYYKRLKTLPMHVAQTAEAVALLERMIFGVGQTSVYELNKNTREGGRIQGIHGFPILTAGPRNIKPSADSTPFIHITDHGYKVSTNPSPAKVDAATRALQFAMLRVVDWCISTGADDFVESASIHPYRSLMREGKWLLENVCELSPWVVTEEDPSAIEELLAQIPYEETEERITLVDGENLVIDINGLSKDQDGIINDAKQLGTIVAFEESKIYSQAAKVLPAIANYYGQEPAVNYVNSLR